jgi:hypothetical protein
VPALVQKLPVAQSASAAHEAGQNPVVPLQTRLPEQLCVGVAPCGSTVQIPSDTPLLLAAAPDEVAAASVHTSHGPAHDDAQHTPSWHAYEVAQSESPAHVAPTRPETLKA